ncbi:MAG: S24 family peptidase [Bacillota bacterium]|nr:S24 family peptidase [Bacillota bacterium]
MRGSTLKEILKQSGITVSELARRVDVPQQTLYSMVKRDNQKVDFDLMMRICSELNVPLECMCEGITSPAMPDAEEMNLVSRYRRLDESGRKLTNLVIDHELCRVESEVSEESTEMKIIPLYATPAAAGYASPALGEDYTDYMIPASSKADFAVRIDGDSMEPYIADGSVALCKRGAIIHDGDVGLFFVDDDMKCKQYCQDYAGNVYLFSANRKRSDADVEIKASAGIMLMCFGKVLLEKSIPLPEM